MLIQLVLTVAWATLHITITYCRLLPLLNALANMLC